MTRFHQCITALAIVAALAACSDKNANPASTTSGNPSQALADQFVKGVINHDKALIDSITLPNSMAALGWERTSTNLQSDTNKSFTFKSCGKRSRGDGETCHYLILSNSKPILILNVSTLTDAGNPKIDQYSVGSPEGM